MKVIVNERRNCSERETRERKLRVLQTKGLFLQSKSSPNNFPQINKSRRRVLSEQEDGTRMRKGVRPLEKKSDHCLKHLAKQWTPLNRKNDPATK